MAIEKIRSNSSAIVIFLSLIFPGVSVSGWFGPPDYDECILEHMKGVTSNYAVQQIRGACLRASRSDSWFGPSSYDKCILESMEGITSDDAAMQVRGACLRKSR